MNTFITRPAHFVLICASALTLPTCAWGDEDDALSLQGAPTSKESSPEARDVRLFIEGAVGQSRRRYGPANLSSRRLSIDYTQSWRTAQGLRLTVSNRLDHVHPTEIEGPATINSLREAYGSWQDMDGAYVLEFGRINLRNGPAYGYNPTDYFREGALRSVTSTDPLALRENRLGTVMWRAQRLWTGGNLSISLAPKLANAANNSSFSLDLGATNRRQRGLLSWSHQLSEGLNTQLLVYSEEGRSPQWGLSATALISSAVVGHFETSRSRERDMFSQAFELDAPMSAVNRLATGFTLTTADRLAMTVEYQYNDSAPDRPISAAVPGSDAAGSYLLFAHARQDIATRSALLLYATKKDAGMKNLDITGFFRLNVEDRSRLAWAEARYHWNRIDVALQLQLAQGTVSSEYGLMPSRQAINLLGAWYY